MKAKFFNPSHFDERKATQAAAQFIAMAGGKINYMLLMKLLYLMDRQTIAQWGRPVTGDEYFSMKYGPVLSEVLDLITNPPEPSVNSYWSQHISSASNYIVSLTSDPGDDELSENEENIIRNTHTAYGGYNQFVLAEHLHEALPEWTPVERGRVPIEIRAILKASNKSESEIKEIEDGIESVHQVKRMFAAR